MIGAIVLTLAVALVVAVARAAIRLESRPRPDRHTTRRI